MTWHDIASLCDEGQVLLTYSETSHRLNDYHLVENWAFPLPLEEILYSKYTQNLQAFLIILREWLGYPLANTLLYYFHDKLILLAIVFISHQEKLEQSSESSSSVHEAPNYKTQIKVFYSRK